MKVINKTEESFKCFLKHILQEYCTAWGAESSTLAAINTWHQFVLPEIPFWILKQQIKHNFTCFQWEEGGMRSMAMIHRKSRNKLRKQMWATHTHTQRHSSKSNVINESLNSLMGSTQECSHRRSRKCRVKWYKQSVGAREEGGRPEQPHVAVRLRMQTVSAVYTLLRLTGSAAAPPTASWKSYCIILFSTCWWKIILLFYSHLLIKLSVLRLD